MSAMQLCIVEVHIGSKFSESKGVGLHEDGALGPLRSKETRHTTPFADTEVRYVGINFLVQGLECFWLPQPRLHIIIKFP